MNVLIARDYEFADALLRRLESTETTESAALDRDRARGMIAAFMAERREELLGHLDALVLRTIETGVKVIAREAVVEALARGQGMVQCDSCQGWIEPRGLHLTGCEICWRWPRKGA